MLEIPFGNIVSHDKMDLWAKNWHNMMKYAMKIGTYKDLWNAPIVGYFLF
jgi:hypothetical protein